MDRDKQNILANLVIAGFVVFILALLVAVPLYALPQFGVYRAGLSGEAQLKKAEQNRRIVVEEAQAELDAADLKRQTDVIRAEGIAEANQIISGSLTPEYLRWLFVNQLGDAEGDIIYIPTEAGLPILEARPR